MSNVVEVDNVLTKVESTETDSSLTSSVPPTVLQNVVNTVVSRLGGREVNPQTLMVIVKYARK